MNDATLERLFYVLKEWGADDTVAGHLVNEIEKVVEEPEIIGSCLPICRVCRTPQRAKPEPVRAEAPL